MSLRLRAILFLIVIYVSLARETMSGTIDASNAQYKQDIIRLSKSAEMRNYLDKSHDPCENFYDFACGNYYSLNEPYLPPFQNNAFATISKALRRKFSKLLTKDSNATDLPIERKVKDFYKSCMALKPSPRIYEQKLKEIINEFGEMPILAGQAKWRAHEAEFDWLQVVAKIFHRYGKRIILGCHVDIDIANRSVNRLRLLYQNIPLESASIYTDAVHAAIRRGRKSSIARTLRDYFGIDSKLAEKTAEQIFEFETELFADESDAESEEENATEPPDDDDDGEDNIDELLSNYTTIEEMHDKYYPKLDVKRLVNISLGGYIPSDQVYDYLEDEFEKVMQIIQQTPKQKLANYIYYTLLENFILRVAKTQKEMCVMEVKEHFAKVMDNMVYRQYTTKQTEQDVKYMWETIKAAFHNVLNSNRLAWMNEETRTYALEKLKAMKMEINSYENVNLTQEFQSLAITENDYIANMKAIFAFTAQQLRNKLNQTAAVYDEAKVLSFTPVYVVTENIIKVPVSILQPYYLWSDFYPNALKFGTLGFLMSHELIHGFDEEGRFFDKSGNIRKWWDKGSSQYFKNHTKCFSKQYHAYEYNGHLLPELQTQSENIADNGGIRLAYDAYLQWYEDNYRTYHKMSMESLPRLNYTSRQLFFISYGQLWCSATHEVLRDYAASTDDHVPDKIRVIGPLANFEEFSKEFKCPIGSFMNPAEKCFIY